MVLLNPENNTNIYSGDRQNRKTCTEKKTIKYEPQKQHRMKLIGKVQEKESGKI